MSVLKSPEGAAHIVAPGFNRGFRVDQRMCATGKMGKIDAPFWHTDAHLIRRITSPHVRSRRYQMQITELHGEIVSIFCATADVGNMKFVIAF